MKLNMEEEYSFWKLNYISCEGNHRWGTLRAPHDWDTLQVEYEAYNLIQGGCGDDISEIESVEYLGYGGPYKYDYTYELY